MTADYIRRSIDETNADIDLIRVGAEIASLGDLGEGVLEDLTEGRSISWLLGIFGTFLTEEAAAFLENFDENDALARTHLTLAIACR